MPPTEFRVKRVFRGCNGLMTLRAREADSGGAHPKALVDQGGCRGPGRPGDGQGPIWALWLLPREGGGGNGNGAGAALGPGTARTEGPHERILHVGHPWIVPPPTIGQKCLKYDRFLYELHTFFACNPQNQSHSFGGFSAGDRLA